MSLRLQMRHLNYVFRSNNRSPLVRPFFKHHLSLLTPAPLPHEMSFFVPEWRKHDLNHPTSIINACYQAFDHLDVKYDFSQCTLITLFQLPLHYLFQSYPSDHWLHKHRKFTAAKFFTYDTRLRRLRLQVETEYVELPFLCRRLHKDILIYRTVKLQPYLIPYIVNDVIDGNQLVYNSSSLSDQLQQHPLWLDYTPKIYRNHHLRDIISTIGLISEIDLKIFWSLPLLLQARSHWYRVLSQKLPTAPYLQQIGILENSQCRLCNAEEEYLEHFLVTCSIKKDIWMMVLKYHYPNFIFTTDHILQALLRLQVPLPPRSNQVAPLLVLLSTSQYYIWYAYWQMIIQKVPFRPDHIIQKINHQVSILLNSSSTID